MEGQLLLARSARQPHARDLRLLVLAGRRGINVPAANLLPINADRDRQGSRASYNCRPQARAMSHPVPHDEYGGGQVVRQTTNQLWQRVSPPPRRQPR